MSKKDERPDLPEHLTPEYYGTPSNPGKGVAALLRDLTTVGLPGNTVADALTKGTPAPMPEPEPSRRTKATVRVLLSYDYCHFEESIELTGDNIPLADIDNARKDVQRLCDKAVGQYQTAKNEAIKQTASSSERQKLRNEVAEIRKKPEKDWDLIEKAKVKTLDDFDHQTKYDYNDDEFYPYKDH
jgi:hypothetical protein